MTIFQGDLRISTNVKMDDGSRAVGTRLSESVCEAVLDRGGDLGRPGLRGQRLVHHGLRADPRPAGRIIGVLYVGLLQAPFVHQLQRDSARCSWRSWSAATLASLVLLFLANELVLRPIRHVVAMAQKVIGGDLSARVGIRPPGEMGVLCRAVDSMAQAVAEREELLKQATRQQIGRSEQLASVGRLAAGVAHEINNPLTGVLAFADLMREKENMDDQDREDLDLIIRETKRAREIVRGLLDFARETPSVQDPTGHQRRGPADDCGCWASARRFRTSTSSRTSPRTCRRSTATRTNSSRCCVNLSLNACEAMPDGGTLMVGTSGRRRPGRGRGDRHRLRHQDGAPGQDLRAVLHDQAGRQRDRLGA